MQENKLLLTENPEIEPTADVLQSDLKESYTTFEELSAILTDEHSLTMTWKYYKDSKAWLCKVAYKKKTNFWLSVWDGYFKTSFFFLERHLEGIANLETTKNSYRFEKEFGKMIPIVFDIKSSNQLSDLLKMVEYKKSVK